MSIANFYRPDQRRGPGGKWADEGRGRQPHSKQEGKKAVVTTVHKPEQPSVPPRGQHPPGHPQEPSVSGHESFQQYQATPPTYKEGGKVPETPEQLQIVKVAMGGKVSMFDVKGVLDEAKATGNTQLASYLEGIKSDPDGKAKWFHDLMEMADAVGRMKGYPAEVGAVEANLGVTPFRGKAATELESLAGYYSSTRYKGWLKDAKVEAHRLNLQMRDVVKATGVWEGSAEPSASIWLRGDRDDVEQFAKNLAGEYNQDGVMVFYGAREPAGEAGSVGRTGQMSAMYTVTGVADQKKAVEAMGRYGISGGRFVPGKSGDHILEIIDTDGTLYDKVLDLGKEVGGKILGTPGEAKLLFGGQDYPKRSKPHVGRGIMYGNEAALSDERRAMGKPPLTLHPHTKQQAPAGTAARAQ
jgi:hypothetical protein